MATDPMETFRALLEAPQERTYPGSKKTRAVVADAERQAEPEAWDAHPWLLSIDGVVTEMFLVGDLANALGGRSPHTIRKWEQRGHIPMADYRYPGSTPSSRRRLYTRAQVERIVAIAKEEGVLDGSRKVAFTNFPQRVKSVFASGRAKK